MSSSHAALSPSASARWLTCPGSVPLCASVPDEAGEAARRGTLCHEHLAARLIGGIQPDLLLTEEEGRLVDAAVAYVDGRLAAGWRLLGVEMAVPAGMAFGMSNLLWGTADVVLENGEYIEIIDAKFGFEEVPAEGNTQLLLYALGIVHGRFRGLQGCGGVILTIVQPRNPTPVRTWGLTIEDLNRWRDEQAPNVERAAAALADGSTEYHASEKACRWCRGASVCPELREQVHRAAEALFKVEVGSIAPPALAALLDKADMVETALKQVRAYALKALALGAEVPGWKRVRSKKHRKWLDEKQAEKALSVLGPRTQYMSKPELLSPAQVEKSMALPKRTLDTLAPQPEGDPVLAKVSDPRPAIEPDFTDTAQTTKELSP